MGWAGQAGRSNELRLRHVWRTAVRALSVKGTPERFLSRIFVYNGWNRVQTVWHWHKQHSPTRVMIPDEQWQRFFDNLEIMGIVTVAAKASGIGVRTVYTHIEAGKAKDATPEQREWLARYEEANRASLDRLEAEVFRRGHDGVQRPMFTKDGDPIMMPAKDGQPAYHYFETTYDSGLLMFLLKARDPGRFKDRVAQEMTGANGGPIQTETKVIAVPAIEEGAPE